MKKNLKRFIILLLLARMTFVQAQDAAIDSLTLTEILNKIMGNYPSLIKAENEQKAAEAKIGLTKNSLSA